MNKAQNHRDEIYKKKKQESLTMISFLTTLKENLEPDKAFNIALKAFTRYMIGIYENVLVSTKIGSQERFDKFRVFYEDYAEKTPYLKIIETTPNILKVKYERCPFFEILKDLGLDDLAYAFCLSDPAFTEKLLPGVKFSRTNTIAKGGIYCDNTWEFR